MTDLGMTEPGPGPTLVVNDAVIGGIGGHREVSAGDPLEIPERRAIPNELEPRAPGRAAAEVDLHGMARRRVKDGGHMHRHVVAVSASRAVPIPVAAPRIAGKARRQRPT